MADVALNVDARNRALRSLIQGLAIDVGVVTVTAIYTYSKTLEDWGDVQWGILSLTLIKTALQVIASYVMRAYMDKSSIPTPLPPAPVPAPADATSIPEAEYDARHDDDGVGG